MQYYRCKCGNRESVGSMSPAQCAKCEKCGSDLALGPSSHSEPKPHDFTGSIEQMSENGPVSVPVCRYCHRTRWEIEHVANEIQPADRDVNI